MFELGPISRHPIAVLLVSTVLLAAPLSPVLAQDEGTLVVANNDTDPAKKGIATKAVEKVKEVAKSATDIFSRVPCRSPNSSGSRRMPRRSSAVPDPAERVSPSRP